jgi:hypothetical protein
MGREMSAMHTRIYKHSLTCLLTDWTDAAANSQMYIQHTHKKQNKNTQPKNKTRRDPTKKTIPTTGPRPKTPQSRESSREITHTKTEGEFGREEWNAEGNKKKRRQHDLQGN